MAQLFRRIWQSWRVLGGDIGDFQGRMILTLFYYVIVPIFAFAMRLARDPLNLRHTRATDWIARTEVGNQIQSGRRQY